MKTFGMKRQWSIFAISLYVISFCLMILTISLKKNYHEDEIFTYGLANHKGGITFSFEEGVTYEPAGSVFAENLTAGKGRQFDYATVWENQIQDVHPPLYYVMVHTISSFFPGRFSRWFAGIINIGFGLATLYVLRKILPHFIADGKVCSLISFAFVLSSGILSAVSFLRMYMMAMFFVTMLSYLFIRQLGEKSGIKFYISIFAVTVLGALTHYYCIVFAVLISCVYGVWLLVRKEWKNLLFFCLSMGAAGIVSYLAFPAMITHMFQSGRGTEALHNLSNSADYWERIKRFFGLVNNQMFGGILGYILAAFLFFGIFWLLAKKEGEKQEGFGQKYMKYFLLILPSVIYFLLVSKMAAYQVDRYIVPIYAIAFIWVLCLSYNLLKASLKNTALAVAILLAVVTVGSWQNVSWEYLYKSQEVMMKEAADYQDVDCVCIYNGAWQIWPMLVEAVNYKSITFISKDNEELLAKLEQNSSDRIILSLVGIGDKESYLNNILNHSAKMTQSKSIGNHVYYQSFYLY